MDYYTGLLGIFVWGGSSDKDITQDVILGEVWGGGGGGAEKIELLNSRSPETQFFEMAYCVH